MIGVCLAQERQRKESQDLETHSPGLKYLTMTVLPTSDFHAPPPLSGGLDLNSSSSGCARLGSGVAPPLGEVKEEVAVQIVLVRRHRRAVGAAV